jgi:hypothetical protein
MPQEGAWATVKQRKYALGSGKKKRKNGFVFRYDGGIHNAEIRSPQTAIQCFIQIKIVMGKVCLLRLSDRTIPQTTVCACAVETLE